LCVVSTTGSGTNRNRPAACRVFRRAQGELDREGVDRNRTNDPAIYGELRVAQDAGCHNAAHDVLGGCLGGRDPVVFYGAFIGDSKDDIVRLYVEYRAGRFDRLTKLANPRLDSGRVAVSGQGGERH
jgi:hypothetical protein